VAGDDAVVAGPCALGKSPERVRNTGNLLKFGL
jgi:hypothetical protein